MTCPSCGNTHDDGNYCPQCNADAFLYLGAINISNRLYNKGLAKVKASDLSGAQECLAKSIAINKANTHARNLLGLVQYEVGLIGDAIKNWVMSCGFLKEDNPAMDYIELFQKNGRVLERLNDATVIYNLAIKDMQQKSDDMAIIKLKQAVDLNPKFVDALNLLALCYILQKDNDKALAIIDRVLSIDTTNIIALAYYSELNPNASASRLTGQKGLFTRRRNAPESATASSGDSVGAGTLTAPYKKVTILERRNVSFHLAGVISLVLGVVIALAAVYVLIIPAMNRNHINQLEAMRNQLTLAEQTYEYLSEEKETEIAAMEDQVEQYRAREVALANEMDLLTRNAQVLVSFEHYREGRMREAVDGLGGMETTGLSLDIAERVHVIRATAYPMLADHYYREGRAAFDAEDFPKARVDFERAYRYVQHIDDVNLYINVIYRMAWTYSLIEEYGLAIQYFEHLLEEFPDHALAALSRNRLNDIS